MVDLSKSEREQDQFFGRSLIDARHGDRQSLGDLLGLYRDYLKAVATTHMGVRLKQRLSASDIVQDALLSAHRDFVDFRGETEIEFVSWLRTIVVNCVRGAIDTHINAKKRDLRREVATVNRSGESSVRASGMASYPSAVNESPSTILGRRETAHHVGRHLSYLKPDYRRVIVMRIFQGLSFEEIGRNMNRSAGAVRMLWMRALAEFKRSYDS